MAEHEMQNPEVIRGMVEDYWRSFLAMASQNQSVARDIQLRFDERIAAMASLMSKENANVFLMAIEEERDKLFLEYDRDPDAQKRRLSIQFNRNQQPSSQRNEMGELIVNTAVRATIWQVIFSIFRR